MTLPEIYQVVLYFVILGILGPSFGDFSYYFLLDVCNISKFQYSMLGAFGKVTTIMGVFVYKQYLKEIEVRKIFFLGCAFGICASWS